MLLATMALVARYDRFPSIGDRVLVQFRDDDDPRPQKYRNRPSYKDELYTSTVNFVANSGIDVSWKYAFPGADLYNA